MSSICQWQQNVRSVFLRIWNLIECVSIKITFKIDSIASSKRCCCGLYFFFILVLNLEGFQTHILKYESASENCRQSNVRKTLMWRRINKKNECNLIIYIYFSRLTSNSFSIVQVFDADRKVANIFIGKKGDEKWKQLKNVMKKVLLIRFFSRLEMK